MSATSLKKKKRSGTSGDILLHDQAPDCTGSHGMTKPDCPDCTCNHSSTDTSQRGGAERSRVLLLNASFEPLNVISLRRAVVLLLREKADVVHDNPAGIFFSSVHIQIQSPLVIRLRHYVKIPYKSAVPLTRTALMQRDHHTCVYCGAKADTIDHVVPRSRGGEHTWENCVASCSSCNHRKADKLLSELGWKLNLTLSQPQDRYWRLVSTVKEIHPVWETYLYPGRKHNIAV